MYMVNLASSKVLLSTTKVQAAKTTMADGIRVSLSLYVNE